MPANTSVSVRLMAWSMGLCPLLLAVAVHTGLKSVPLSIEMPKQPALSFSQYAVDLRTINPASTIEAYYTFQNRGTEPVRIDKVEASCNCLKTHIQGARENVIQPGSRGRIVVQMQPGNTSPGPHEYFLNVKYKDSEERAIPLLFKVTIPATLWVTPPSLAFYHPKGSLPTPAEFTVTDGRGSRIEILDVSINTELVQTAIGETTRTPQGNFQQKINIVVAGDLPPGTSQHMLKIKTTDPDHPELRVPIRLDGEVEAADAKSDETQDHEQKPDTVKSAASDGQK